MHKQGDIVLVPFPFTDLSGQKVRPAIILSRQENRDDVTVCFVSSINTKKILLNEILISEKDKSFADTGLKVRSIVKVTKIATLEKKVILGKLGMLGPENLNKIKGILKNHFEI